MIDRPLRIGVFLGHLDSLFYTRAIPLFRQSALELGLQVFVADAEGNPTVFNKQDLDGLVYWYDRRLGGLAPASFSSSLPVICLSFVQEGLPTVLIDNGPPIRALVQHLVQNHQCRSLAFLGGPIQQDDSIHRRDSFIDEMHAQGLEVPPQFILEDDFTSEAGFRMALTLLESGETVDAIVSASDSIAIGALAACRYKGLQVPRDILLTGFDDVAEAALVQPDLTTATQPFAEMIHRALVLLLEKIAGREVPMITQLPAHLRIRSSCGCSSLPQDIAIGLPLGSDARSNPLIIAWLNQHGQEFSELCDCDQDTGLAQDYEKRLLDAVNRLLSECPADMLEFTSWAFWLDRIEQRMRERQSPVTLGLAFLVVKERVNELIQQAAFARRVRFLDKMKRADELYRQVNLTPSFKTVTRDFFAYCRTLDLPAALMQVAVGKRTRYFMQHGDASKTLVATREDLCRVFAEWMTEPGLFLLLELETNDLQRSLGQVLLAFDGGYPVQYMGIARQLGKILKAYQLFQTQKRMATRLFQRQKRLEVLQQRLLAAIDEIRSTQDDLIRVAHEDAHTHLVAGLAHELNTPFGVALTAISYIHSHAIELLQSLDAKTLSHRQFETFLQNLQSADTMLNSNLEKTRKLLADMQSLRVNKTDYEQRELDIVALLRQDSQRLELVAAAYGYRLQFDATGECWCKVSPGALSQVINCLVSNAIDHAFKGKIGGGTIRLGLNRKEDAILISLSDNGIGLPPRVVSRIFEPFANELAGSGKIGLGLHLVHTLVSGPLGGAVAYAENPGGGSCFTISLGI